MKAIQVFDGDGEHPRVAFDDHWEDVTYHAIRDGYQTFHSIREHLGEHPTPYREIDKALQRLRKRGLIYFHLGHRAWVLSTPGNDPG